jgi:TATA-box binding protein (TBP) (component of TFIID and TFIIIB)
MQTPCLSTMVVLYNTNLKFDTTLLVNCIPLNSEIIKIEKRGVLKRGESKRDKIKRRVKNEKKPQNNTGFCHNSLTLVMLSKGDGSLPEKEITIKIFQNGVFHMTGILHEYYHTFTIEKLLNVLWEDCQSAILDKPEKVEILQKRVVLMNYTTQLISGDTVAREALYNAIRLGDFENVTAHYDPDVYPGVKIHIGPNKWTAKVFRTGKIILTGINDESEVHSFISKLLSLFEKVLPAKSLKFDTSNTVVRSSAPKAR